MENIKTMGFIAWVLMCSLWLSAGAKQIGFRIGDSGGPVCVLVRFKDGVRSLNECKLAWPPTASEHLGDGWNGISALSKWASDKKPFASLLLRDLVSKIFTAKKVNSTILIKDSRDEDEPCLPVRSGDMLFHGSLALNGAATGEGESEPAPMFMSKSGFENCDPRVSAPLKSGSLVMSLRKESLHGSIVMNKLYRFLFGA